MPRKRNTPTDYDLDGLAPDEAEAIALPDYSKIPGFPQGACPPVRNRGGSFNIEYLRWRMQRLNALNEYAYATKGAPLPNFRQSTEAIVLEAEMMGFDKRKLLDERSEADINEETVQRLIAAPESLLELTDKRIASLESLLDSAIDRTATAFMEMAADNQGKDTLGADVDFDRPGEPDPKQNGTATVLRRWLSLLRKVRTIKKSIRDPEWVPRSPDHPNYVYHASRFLRYMAYVGRVQTESQRYIGADAGGGDVYYHFGRHHGWMAAGFWLALNQREIRPDMTLTPQGSHPYTGVMVVIGPGHGKTDFASHFYGLRIAERPRTQLLLLHALTPQAIKSNQYIQKLFGEDTPNGRRSRALFPNVPHLAKHGNGQPTTKLDIGAATKQNTITASGEQTAGSGSDASDIWFDDIVDQSAQDQPTERNRVFHRVNGTWMRRLRGKQGTFHVTTTTLWHPDDAHSRRINLIKEGKEWTKLIIMRCGGPRENFKPLWPEAYDSAYLRKEYSKIQAEPYSCIYECNPISEATRIVKSLRFYDPSGSEHAAFMASAVKHLSLDPSATNTDKSDKAGMVYAALGNLRTERKEADHTVSSMETRLRIIEAQRVPATQAELTDHVAAYCKTHPTDYVHIETRSGFKGIAEMFERLWKIKPICHDPTNKKKGQRLKEAAPYLEHSGEGIGIRAVVELPGVLNERGEVECRPDVKWLADEILNFGAHATDDGVDAVTQLVNWLAPNLSVGGKGMATTQFLKQHQFKTWMQEQLERVQQQVIDTTGESGPADLLVGAWPLQ